MRHRVLPSLIALCAVALLGWARVVQAEAPPVPGSAAPLSNHELAHERGRGVTQSVRPGTQIAVILWDERGTSRTNTSSGSVASVSQGIGNQQTNSLRQN